MHCSSPESISWQGWSFAVSLCTKASLSKFAALFLEEIMIKTRSFLWARGRAEHFLFWNLDQCCVKQHIFSTTDTTVVIGEDQTELLAAMYWMLKVLFTVEHATSYMRVNYYFFSAFLSLFKFLINMSPGVCCVVMPCVSYSQYILTLECFTHQVFVALTKPALGREDNGAWPRSQGKCDMIFVDNWPVKSTFVHTQCVTSQADGKGIPLI